MFVNYRVLFSIAIGLGLTGGLAARAEEKKPEKPQPAAGKTIVVHIDASKVPPEFLKQLLQFSEKSKPVGEQANKPLKPMADSGKNAKPPQEQPAKPIKPAPEAPAKPMKPAAPEQPLKNQKPGADGGKPVIIQIDASKLSPDLLKQLIQAADKPKPGAQQPAKPNK